MGDKLKDDEFLLESGAVKHLSEREILALRQGLVGASDLEQGLKINKGTLRKFAQEQTKRGVNVYQKYGIGRPAISNRYMIRLAVFSKMWAVIKEKIKEMKITQEPFKIPPPGSTIADLIKDGGVYKLSRLEGLMKFKVRALKSRYYALLKAGEDPKQAFGIYKDGKLFLVDMNRFGEWYQQQSFR